MFYFLDPGPGLQHAGAGPRRGDDSAREGQHFRGDQIVAALPRAAAALGGIVALVFDAVEVGPVHVAGDVLAVEAGGVELLDLGVALARGLDEVIEVLVDELVGADDPGDLLLRSEE